MNRGRTADICKIYCGLLLRGILRMPNIYHSNRWKLQRRDGSSVGGVNKGKRKAAEELAGWMCVHVSAGLDGPHVFNLEVDAAEDDSRF